MKAKIQDKHYDVICRCREDGTETKCCEWSLVFDSPRFVSDGIRIDACVKGMRKAHWKIQWWKFKQWLRAFPFSLVYEEGE